MGDSVWWDWDIQLPEIKEIPEVVLAYDLWQAAAGALDRDPHGSPDRSRVEQEAYDHYHDVLDEALDYHGLDYSKGEWHHSDGQSTPVDL